MSNHQYQMKYLYKISEEELKAVFGDLLEINENYFEYGENDEPFQPEDRQLSRDSQNGNKIHHVYIKTMQHVSILLDYLSYDKSNWDYEPKLCIHLPNGNEINTNRRGNYGHKLDKGDYLIVCNNVLEALRSGVIGKVKTNTNHWELIDKLSSTIQAQNSIINELRAKISTLTPMVKTDDLPF